MSAHRFDRNTHTHTDLQQKLVLCDPLHWFEQVGIEGELMAQLDLDALEEGLALGRLGDQRL